MASHIFGDLDGIQADAAELQNISDNQAAAMNALASMLDTAATAMQGPAGAMLQQVGADMHTTGMMFSGQFGDHSQKMHHNQVTLDSTDGDNHGIIAAVGNITV